MPDNDEDFERVKLDDGFDALPIQDKPKKIGSGHLQFGGNVPQHERWMNAAERREWYRADMLDAFGAEYLAEDTANQAIYKNFKRSSRKDAPSVRICKHESTTDNNPDLFN